MHLEDGTERKEKQYSGLTALSTFIRGKQRRRRRVWRKVSSWDKRESRETTIKKASPLNGKLLCEISRNDESNGIKGWVEETKWQKWAIRRNLFHWIVAVSSIHVKLTTTMNHRIVSRLHKSVPSVLWVVANESQSVAQAYLGKLSFRSTRQPRTMFRPRQRVRMMRHAV